MNIYIGNLDFQINESDLEEYFGEYGAVSSAKLIMDKYSGRSKGFGFVTMENDDEGAKAIEGLNGASLSNRVIVVNEARPKKDNFSG